MKITEKDLKIVEFLDIVGVADTSTINKMFFNNSVKACKNRMKPLYDFKLVKRMDRIYINQEYVYYTKKKPKQLEHKLLFSRFVAELKYGGAEIIKIKCPLKISDVIADGFIVYKVNETTRIALVEVENQKSFKSNMSKYKSLYRSMAWKEYFNVFPNIIIVSNEREIKIDDLNLIFIKKDFSNIDKILE